MGTIRGIGKGNNMLYLSGIQSEKVITEDIVKEVVKQVEKKAAELGILIGFWDEKEFEDKTGKKFENLKPVGKKEK